MSKPRFPRSFVEELAVGDVVAVVGSGPSVAAGYPSWEKLLDAMIQECENEAPGMAVTRERRRELRKGHLLEVAGECTRLLSPAHYRRFMQKVFSGNAIGPHGLHERLASLPFSSFLTTNYDDLLEVALRKHRVGQPVDVFSWKNVAMLADAVQRRRCYVFKLHGEIGDIESVVISQQHYHDLLFRNEPYQTALSQVLLSRTALFVGYGLRDLDLLLALGRHSTVFRGFSRTHYALLPDVSGVLARSFEANFGIKVIPYSRKRNDNALDEALAALTEAVESASSARSANNLQSVEHLLDVERAFCTDMGTYIEATRARFLRHQLGLKLSAEDRDLIDRSISYWETLDTTRTHLEGQLRQRERLAGCGKTVEFGNCILRVA